MDFRICALFGGKYSNKTIYAAIANLFRMYNFTSRLIYIKNAEAFRTPRSSFLIYRLYQLIYALYIHTSFSCSRM